MKKTISLILAVALLAGLCSCEKVPGERPENVVQLTYWTSDEIYKENMDQCVRRYNEKSEIKIAVHTSIYSMDELDYKLWASLQAGIETPDIVDLEQSRFGRYMNPKNNYLIPINTIVDALKDQMVVPAYDKYREKGFYYGLDYYENNCVVFYNGSLMEKAGIDPGSILTLEDFRAAGKRLMEQMGIPLLAVDYTDDLVFETLLTAGGGGYCSSQNRVSVADDIAVKTLEALADMIHVDSIAVTAPGGDFFSYAFYNAFGSGQIGAVIAPFWYAAYIRRYMPDLQGKVWVGKIPKMFGRSQGARVSGVATAIPIKSEHAILIKDFLRATRMNTGGCAEGFENLFADPIIPATYAEQDLSGIGRRAALFQNDGAALLAGIRQDAVNPVLGDQYYDIAEAIRSKVLFSVLKESAETPADALKALAEDMLQRAEGAKAAQ